MDLAHTGSRMEIMPEGSMEIKHVDEEPYATPESLLQDLHRP
jgi:hypothetical protein